MDTQKVTLKKMEASSIDDFLEWASDDAVTQYMMWNSYRSRSEAESFFTNVVEKHPWFQAICLGEKVIGSITLDRGKGLDCYKAELGYVIARRYWGNGLTTEAVRLAVEKGFTDLGVTRIEAYVDPQNVGSQRVLEKNGFVREGLIKGCVVQKDVVKDRILFSISR